MTLMAVIRRPRRAKRAFQIAQRLSNGEPIGPSRICLVCRRLFDDITDRDSIGRGACDGCWQRVLATVGTHGTAREIERIHGC